MLKQTISMAKANAKANTAEAHLQMLMLKHTNSTAKANAKANADKAHSQMLMLKQMLILGLKLILKLLRLKPTHKMLKLMLMQMLKVKADANAKEIKQKAHS